MVPKLHTLVYLRVGDASPMTVEVNGYRRRRPCVMIVPWLSDALEPSRTDIATPGGWTGKPLRLVGWLVPFNRASFLRYFRLLYFSFCMISDSGNFLQFQEDFNSSSGPVLPKPLEVCLARSLQLVRQWD